MSTPIVILTLVHVVISLIGIAAGAVVVYGMLSAKRLARWTAVFLVTTVLTSATGFLFPFQKLLPSHIVGAISLVILAVTIYALYSRRLAGAWRWVYVMTAVAAFYFNVFVAVVQAFLKVPVLKAAAPTQTEAPFAVTQLVVLVVFIALGIAAARKFHPISAPESPD